MKNIRAGLLVTWLCVVCLLCGFPPVRVTATYPLISRGVVYEVEQQYDFTPVWALSGGAHVDVSRLAILLLCVTALFGATYAVTTFPITPKGFLYGALTVVLLAISSWGITVYVRHQSAIRAAARASGMRFTRALAYSDSLICLLERRGAHRGGLGLTQYVDSIQWADLVRRRLPLAARARTDTSVIDSIKSVWSRKRSEVPLSRRTLDPDVEAYMRSLGYKRDSLDLPAKSGATR